jgi:hypothetical protein
MVTVRTKDGWPQSFRAQDRPIVIAEVLDCWRESRAWWNQEGDIWLWRVLGENQGVYELAHDMSQGQWWIARIYD